MPPQLSEHLKEVCDAPLTIDHKKYLHLSGCPFPVDFDYAAKGKICINYRLKSANGERAYRKIIIDKKDTKFGCMYNFFYLIFTQILKHARFFVETMRFINN